MRLRKNKRSNHWKAIISKEIATVFAIVWYIKVELLRTKQLPPYITYTQIDKVPELRRDVHQQASSIYSRLYRSNDKASKFHVADTKQKNLDGKVGTISSYDTDKSCYIVQVSDNKQGNSINSTELALSPEYMEPCSYAKLGSVASSAAYDSCQVNIKNHFASTFPHAPPSLTFWPCVFSEIGGHSHTPHMEGENERTKLMTMLEKKEIIVNSEAKQLQEQQLELEKGLSKMYSTRQPVQKRPRTIIQQKKNRQSASCNEQIECVWKARMQYAISKHGQKRDYSREKKDDEYMFTFPFATADNSLHSCCTDLKEFCNESEGNDIPDSFYGQNHFAASIIVDETSIKSVRPGYNMDNDMMDFGLSW